MNLEICRYDGSSNMKWYDNLNLVGIQFSVPFSCLSKDIPLIKCSLSLVYPLNNSNNVFHKFIFMLVEYVFPLSNITSISCFLWLVTNGSQGAKN